MPDLDGLYMVYRPGTQVKVRGNVWTVRSVTLTTAGETYDLNDSFYTSMVDIPGSGIEPIEGTEYIRLGMAD